MPWYRSGTVNVTNNSTSVVGNGTNWTQAVEVGEAFYGPDSKVYEIANVVSDTQLTLATPYQGSTASGQSYVIIPSQSYIRELAAEAAALIANYGATMSTAGAGRFADGTVTAPGIRFTADDDTGVRRTGANALALVAGGADRVAVTTSGASVTGALTVSGTITAIGKLTTAASRAGGAGLSLPHGAAPTTPSDGDVWTTTSGVFARVNGATKTVAFTDSSITGNAATATKLQTARTISLSGDVSGSASFDGSANATINTSIAKPSAATYTYDAQGRVTGISETLPAGTRSTTITYDAQGRVSTVKVTQGSQTRTTTYSYDAQGRVSGVTVS